MEKYTEDRINEELKSLNGWRFNGNEIEKDFVFKDFREAMSQMIKISFIAEEMNHHPYWTNVYNQLKIKLSTHDANGITKKDIDIASRIDALEW